MTAARVLLSLFSTPLEFISLRPVLSTNLRPALMDHGHDLVGFTLPTESGFDTTRGLLHGGPTAISQLPCVALLNSV